MYFRPATAQDAYNISALIQGLAHSFVLNFVGSNAEQFWASVSESAEAEYINNPRYSFTLSLAGDTLAGLIAMRDTNHIFHLFVAPKFQRIGLASQLWALAKGHAVQAGHNSAFTVNSTLAAVPVYERFGFAATSSVMQNHGISFIPMQLPASHGYD